MGRQLEIDSDKEKEMETTKPVSNGFGHIDMTREEFITRWMDYSSQLMPLFLEVNSTGYLDMQLVVEEGAGKMWDKI
jgi:hypothetical protein